MPEPGVTHIIKWKTIRQLPQVMFGPVPCVLAHDILYLELRNILFQKGKIVNMFLHKVSHQYLFFSNCSDGVYFQNAIKIKESGECLPLIEFF